MMKNKQKNDLRNEPQYFKKEAKRCGTTPEHERLCRLFHHICAVGKDQGLDFNKISKSRYEEFLHHLWMDGVISENDIKTFCKPYFIDFIENCKRCIKRLMKQETVYTPKSLQDALLSYGFEKHEIQQAIKELKSSYQLRMLISAEKMAENILEKYKDHSDECKKTLVEMRLTEDRFDRFTIDYVLKNMKL